MAALGAQTTTMVNMPGQSSNFSWETAAQGYCEKTTWEGNCNVSQSGSFQLRGRDAMTWKSAGAACARLCSTCKQCNYLSVSPRWKDCSWFSSCDMSRLKGTVQGFCSARFSELPTSAFEQPIRSIARTATDKETCSSARECKPTLCPRLRFVHIPKNAGSTIREVAREHGVCWGRYGEACSPSRPRSHLGCPCSHSPELAIASTAKAGNVTTFCVARNPYARLVSHYGWAVRKQRRAADGMKANEPLPSACTADGMNAYLYEALSQLALGAHVDKCHLLPQTAYIRTNLCTRVLRTERLRDDFDGLMREWGLPMRLNDSAHRNSGPSNCSHLTTMDLSLSVRSLAAGIYGADFTTLGYLR